MKNKWLAAMFTMAGATLCAGQSVTAEKTTVTVCMDVDQHVLMGVRPLVSAIFAGIAVQIDWREPDFCPAGVGAIRVRFFHGAPRVGTAGALAFAQPYQGIIVVFLDRVEELNRKGVRHAMAHVLVHEITHIVQGIDRHSATGIMKAQWNERDYFAMRCKRLNFAPEDIALIHAGLNASRMAGAAAAPAVVAGR